MKEFHLSCIDQQSHLRSYGRVLLIFEYEEPRCSEVAILALRGGLAALLYRFPYLAGVVELVDNTSKRVKVSYPDSGTYEGHAARIFSPDTTLIDLPTFDYHTLLAETFPYDDFPAKHFCPRSLIDHKGLNAGDHYATDSTNFSNGIPLPVLAAQATFIRGGLVLSVWIHHSIADGTGWGRIFEVWANGVKRFRQGDISLEVGISQQLFQGRDGLEPRAALDAFARTSTAHNYAACTPVQATTLRTVPYTLFSRLFSITTPLISALKTSLSTETGVNITNFVALAALLGTYISEARSRLLLSHSIPKTTLAVVVNLRKHLGPKFTDPDFIGNCMLCAKASYHLSAPSPSTPTILDPPHLTSFALAIAESIKRIEKLWISNRLAPILLSDPPALDNSELTFGNGPDLYITTWQHMGADTEWCIPGTKEGKPSAIRRAAWASEGGIVILPKRKGDVGPFEVMVSLAEEDMKGFEGLMVRDEWVEEDGRESVGVEGYM